MAMVDYMFTCLPVYMFTCSSSNQSDEEVVCGGGNGVGRTRDSVTEWAVGHRQGVQ